MTQKSKLIALMVLATAGIAQPAFSRSLHTHYNSNTQPASMKDVAFEAYAWEPAGHQRRTSNVAQDQWFAAFGDATDHLLPGEIEEPGPR